MKNATMIPTNASLSELASLLEREGAPAFERLEEFQRRDIIERLATPDDAETLEEFEALAGDMLKTIADNIAPRLEECERLLYQYIESQDYLENYWHCFQDDLTGDAEQARERLAELLDDAITLEEYEFLAGEIGAGFHDGVAPNCPAPDENAGPLDRRGPFAAVFDIWRRDDAFMTLGAGGEETMPVDDATERLLGEALDLFNRLDAIGETPRRDFFDLFGVTLCDGAEHDLDAFAVMVTGPEQVAFYLDVESVADSLATYRAERLEKRQ